MNNCYSSYFNLIFDLEKKGQISAPRGMKVYELIDVHLEIDNNKTLLSVPTVRDVVNPETSEGKYLRAEFVWYMSGTRTTSFISRYGSMWDKLKNKFPENDKENRLVNSNYGYQVFYKFPFKDIPKGSLETVYYSMFDWVLQELHRDRDSRKAVIQYTIPSIYREGVSDFTCTQNQQFLIRNNTLYNIVHIRSSDAVLGLTFDIPWWDFVGQLVASETKSNYFKLNVNIGSSHFYERNEDVIDKLIEFSNPHDHVKSLVFKNNIGNLIDIGKEFEKEFDYKFKYNTSLNSRMKNYFWSIFECMHWSYAEALSNLCNIYVTGLTDENTDKETLDYFNSKIFNAVFDIN